MTVRTLYILSDGVVSEGRPSGTLDPSPRQYGRNGNVYVVHRIWAGSDPRSGIIYEVCCEPSIPEGEARRQAKEWNEAFPAIAVPPPGTLL